MHRASRGRAARVRENSRKIIDVAVLSALALALPACGDAAPDSAGTDAAAQDASQIGAVDVSVGGGNWDAHVASDAGSDAQAPPDGGGRDGAPAEDADLDGAADDAGPADGGGSGVDAAGPDAAPPAPVDCSVYAGREGRELCAASAEACEVVFTDRVGCAATCAEAGLTCGAAMENLDGVCGADDERPALDCVAGSGHGSDWCRCVRLGACSPSCAAGQACGDDGCGGRCGPGCGPDDVCEAGRCVAAPVGVECDGDRPTPASLLAEVRGFAEGVTGGDPRNVYHVTTRQDGAPGSLRAGLESPESLYIVFDIEGEIAFDFDDTIRPLSNKTVDGRGRNVRLRDARFDIRDGAHNLVFADFEAYFDNPVDNEGDLFSLRGPGGDDPADYPVYDVWFHHLDLHHAGDGLIDVRGATKITLSWSHLHDHTKVMLHTKDSNDQPSPGMRITYHHNFFDTLTRRSPHFAYGLADFYNNYHKHWYEYGAASIDDARFLSEANVYEARPGDVCVVPCPDPSPHGGGNDFFVSKKAVANDWAPDRTDGFVKSVGDVLINGAQVASRQPERVFDRADHYQTEVEVATPELAARIAAGAGPRRTLCR